MFREGDRIVDVTTGDVATFRYTHHASWPDILAVADWPRGTQVQPGVYGRLFRECEPFIGPRQEASSPVG